MSSSPKQLRERLAEQARYRCGYCLALEVVTGIPLTLEHIIPKARGGQDVEDNLWLSCRLCNEAKGVSTLYNKDDRFPVDNCDKLVLLRYLSIR